MLTTIAKIVITGSIVTFLPKVFAGLGPVWAAILVLSPIVTTISYMNFVYEGGTTQDFRSLITASLFALPLTAFFLGGTLLGTRFLGSYWTIGFGLAVWLTAAVIYSKFSYLTE